MGQHEICLGGKKIGNGNPIYYVAEAGATHTGLGSAKNLVDMAVNAGFNAVKFQIVESKKCPTPDELFNGHKCIDIWKQRELTRDEWKELHAYCEGKALPTFATITDVNQLDWFPSESYKIRSRDIGKLLLIKAVSERCKVIQLDTSYATIQQIRTAVDRTDSEVEIIIHHCPSGYPANMENERLSLIKKYKDEFNCLVGYSAHSNNFTIMAMAIAMGANMIEIPIVEVESKSIAPEVKYAIQGKEVSYTDSEENDYLKEYIKNLKEMEQCL